jgi:NAD+ diphosphatase
MRASSAVTDRPRIDRAAQLRKDSNRLMAALDEPSSLLVPVWRNKSLIAEHSTARVVSVRDSGALIDIADELVWLGLLGGVDCFAIDLSGRESPLSEGALSGKGDFADLRMAAGLLSPEEVELCAYARAMLSWHRHHRHCGLCGTPTKPKEGGHVRECPNDGERHFPRTDPAVMVMIEHADRCVLARQAGFPPGMYSVIAGFVEPGETLEETALREAKEELGLDIADVAYFRSQPWPFPASLMVGFSATASTDALVIDTEELETARWFSREELSNPQGFFYPPAHSLAHHLIARFIEHPDG